MDNERKEVLIEETEAGRRLRETPPSRPKRRWVGWLIAVLAVVLVGVVAALAVYHVQQKRGEEAFEQAKNETTTYVRTVKTADVEEEDDLIEAAEELVESEDEAIGGNLYEETARPAATRGTTVRTTATTAAATYSTTRWDPNQFWEDASRFWDDVSRQVS
ncbi:MAG: hypothetical protein IJ230_00530 [Clostridia bacterium]|nr:hypothetical protein [Clostridia bacterium]